MSKENEKAQIERAKGWILGIINGIEPKMLVDMIKADDIPTLWEFELPPYLGFVKNLVKEHLGEIMEVLTVDTIIEYAEEYRPDLAKILAHPKAVIWMKRFLKKTKFMLKHIDLTPMQIQKKYMQRLLEIKAQRERQQAEAVASMLEEQAKEEENGMVIEKIPEEEVIKEIEEQSLSDDMSEGLSEEELKKVLGSNYNTDLDFL